MKVHLNCRRAFSTSLLAAAIAAGYPPESAPGQTAPTLLIIAPGPEGGGFDRFARAIGTSMEAAGIASRITYENVGTAGGVTALPRLAELSASRRGVLMVTGSVMVGAFVSGGGELAGRITPIARLAIEPLAIAVPADGPKDVQALLAVLRGPGGTTVAGGPNGSPDHLLTRSMVAALGLPDGRVVYQAHAGGKPAAESLLSGRSQVVLTNWSDLLPFVSDGKLRVIAATDMPANAPASVPTLRQSGIAASGGNWRGLVAAPGIDQAERKRLSAIATALARSQTWQSELAQRRWSDSFLADDAFSSFLSADVAGVRAAVAAVRPSAKSP